jgi:hypothetical protein
VQTWTQKSGGSLSAEFVHVRVPCQSTSYCHHSHPAEHRGQSEGAKVKLDRPWSLRTAPSCKRGRKNLVEALVRDLYTYECPVRARPPATTAALRNTEPRSRAQRSIGQALFIAQSALVQTWHKNLVEALVRNLYTFACPARARHTATTATLQYTEARLRAQRSIRTGLGHSVRCAVCWSA